jgi:ribose/xylose/arabinose/galactoside ABC-type transport system permease subunit
MPSGAPSNKETSISTAGVSRTVSQDAGGKTPRSLTALVRVGGLLGAIVLVAFVFEMLTPTFLSLDIVISILRSMCSVAILGLGLTLVIVSGEIDLSVGAMYGLASNALAVIWILGGVPVYLALPLTLLIGAGVGFFNGALSTWYRIPSFIVTLGSYNLLYGLSLLITNATTYNPAYPPEGHSIPPEQIGFFTGLTRQIGAHQVSLEIAWMIAVAAVVGYVLHGSLYGFRLFAVGGNARAAKLASLPVNGYKIIAFIASSVLASVAGILDFSFVQTTQPDIGLSQTFPVFAAVVIGGASLSGGKGTVIGTLGGAFLLAELQTGLAVLSPGPYAQQIFLGLVTIGAVALDILLSRLGRQGRR